VRIIEKVAKKPELGLNGRLLIVLLVVAFSGVPERHKACFLITPLMIKSSQTYAPVQRLSTETDEVTEIHNVHGSNLFHSDQKVGGRTSDQQSFFATTFVDHRSLVNYSLRRAVRH
jgi:hypothetical protein